MTVGLAIRLVLAPFLAHPLDVYSWYFFGSSVVSGKESALDYLSIYHYSLFLFAFPATIAFDLMSRIIPNTTIQVSTLAPSLRVPGVELVPGMLFDFLVKLPLIASDAIIAVLLYRLVLRDSNDDKKATYAGAIWFLNPLTIWISSAWGTFDTLPVLFSVAALYLAVEGRFRFASVADVVSIALKAYSLVLIIPILLMAWKRSRLNGLAAAAGSLIVSALVLYLPSLYQSAGFVAGLVRPSASPAAYSGLSFWTVFTLVVSPGFDPSTISALLIVGSLIPIYYLMAKRIRRFDLKLASACFAVPVLVVLLFYRLVGENFFIWPLPFLCILATNQAVNGKLFWALSMLALLSSVTNSLLPLYLLPLAPWIGNGLAAVVGYAAPYRVAPNGGILPGPSIGKLYLSALGLSSALVITLIIIGIVSTCLVRESPNGRL